MRLLYLTEYFQTPAEGGLMRTWELSHFLRRHGHGVEVVAPGAHHMTGEVPAELRGRFKVRQDVQGIGVTRVRTSAVFRRSYLHRVLYYLSTPVSVLIAGARLPADVVMGSSPPFFLAPGAYLLARLKRVPFVLEVRDAWLEFAVAKGLVPRPLVPLLQAQQRWLLRRADRVVAVTPGIRKLALASLPQSMQGKVHLVMNGYEEDVFRDAPAGRAGQIREEWDLGGKFVAIFTGTIGLSRDGMTCMRAAGRLREEPDLVFAFVGEGEGKRAMEAYARAEGLTNCVFVPLQPRRDMPAWMEVAAVGLNAIKGGESQESSLSNKIFEYLGAGRPVVWSGEGDTTDFLERSGGGICLEPEDDAGMAAAILRLKRDPALAQSLGSTGRRYVIENFSRSRLAAGLERMLAELVGEPSRVPLELEPSL